MELDHKCHAEGCDVKTQPRMLMCRKHWFMVPRPLQAEVWATYRPGQERDKQPTDDYLFAAKAAVEAVARKEGRREPAAAPSAGVEDLPTLDELHGSDPDFTGEMTTAEYIAHIRGYKPAAAPSAAPEERK